MTSVMPGLRPMTQGMLLMPARAATESALSVRPSNRQAKHGRRSPGSSGSLASSSSSSLTVNPNLSVIEVEALLREKVKSKHDELQKAFQTYDVDKSLSVTKGEFRRILEMFCLPLTTEQTETILVKIDQNPNGTVKYCDFLDKFHGGSSRGQHQQDRWVSRTQNMSVNPPKENNIDLVEKMLREKIAANMKTVVKGFRLFDYNRDGKVQRHELRKVLENYCFKLTDQQFDKLVMRYDFHHSGVLDYKDFLQRLGVQVPSQQQQQLEQQSTKGAMSWHPGQDIQHQPTFSIGNDSKTLLAKREARLQGLNFDQVEVEFRKKMRENYVTVKKAFLAFDAHKDGFISLDNLRSVLSHFTIPMTAQLFTRLMERCGVKATGRISWEYFLEKFQDPQSHGNGQTVTIKPNHKFHPVRGDEQPATLEHILELLQNHVENGYSSFKEAFLKIDKNRDGTISRRELRKVLESFKVRLANEQFKAIVRTLDPQHSNTITYQRFLDLFEPTETKEGHKWLNSCHRVNEPRPLVVAWKTVEEILAEKITERWKAVSDALYKCDGKGEGCISPGQLKRIIEKHCLPISQEHFESLVGKVEDQRENGTISYVEFLIRLGVDVKPGDIVGLSTQIHEASEHTRAIHLHGQVVKQARSELLAQERTDSMTPEEVIVRVRDRLSQHATKIRQAFLEFDKQKKGKISKKVFRQVLEEFGMYMSEEQFKDLCSRLSFIDGFMSYTDFISDFQDSGSLSPSSGIGHPPNHKVNPIRGDHYGMSAVEVEEKLRQKLKENFEDLRGAFYKFDENHTGYLTRANFRRMLDAFMIFISQEEFNKLSEKLGFHKKAKISYQDFLEKFEVRDTPEGHKWLNSDHRFNATREAKPMSAEQVHDILTEKAHVRWKDLSKAFISMDGSGSGVITKKELKDTLEKFILPISKAEFKKLWQMYDTEGKGYIDHQDFLYKLGGAQFAPSDTAGTSKRIMQDSYQYLDEHHQMQQARQEKITLNQANRVVKMTTDQLHQKLKDAIREQYPDMYIAFRKYDTAKKGSLSLQQIQQVLTDLKIFIDDEQFSELIDRIGMSTNKSRLSYEDFLKAFQEGRKDNYAPKEPDVSIKSLPNMSPLEAETKLHSKIKQDLETITMAFGAFDHSNCGKVTSSEFRRIMDNFCFQLSDAQFKHIISNQSVNGTNLIDYKTFLSNFRPSTYQDASQLWLDNVDKYTCLKTPLAMPQEDISERVKEKVTARLYPITKEFAEIDYAKIGVVSKDDFLKVFNKEIFRVTEEQFDELWSKLPVNEFGNLDYQAFLKSYSATEDPPGTARPGTNRNSSGAGGGKGEGNAQSPPGTAARPGTRNGSRAGGGSDILRLNTADADQGRGAKLEMVSPRLQSRGGLMTPLVNAEDIEEKLKPVVNKHWKDIQKQCRQSDPNSMGDINGQDFKQILSRYHIELTTDEFTKLMLKYDLKDRGRFCYPAFLKHFVLTMRSMDDTILRRERLPNTRVTVTPGTPNAAYEGAMQRLRKGVSQNWKEMRRVFRSIDKSATGVLPPIHFKQVLKEFHINLSEEDFYHLMCYYDKSLKGQISYNDFLRSCLQAP